MQQQTKPFAGCGQVIRGAMGRPAQRAMPTHRRALAMRVAGLAAALFVAAACKGGSEGGPPGPTPSISVSLGSASLTVTQGTTADVQVTVTGAGGFSGSPSVSVEGVPSGVTGSISGSSTVGATTTATVTVAAAVTAAPGSYPITVRASGAGLSATASLTLVVAPAPALSFTLAPTTVTAVRGRTARVDVTLTRTNLPAPVTIAVEGAPTGVTATVDPAPATGTSASISFTVDAAAATGSTSLVIRAMAAGVAPVTQPLQLNIVDPASIRVSLAQPAQSIDQGATATNAVTLTRTNYSGAVTLALEGAPSGVVATFTPSPVPGTSASLSLAVAASVPAGNYALTVRATGDSLTATAALTLTVNVPAGFTLSAPSSTITVGASANVPITITRANFTGAVTLTLEGAPNGITGVFTPASPTGTTATLALQATGVVALGAYALTVKGTAAGQDVRTTPFALTVVPVVGSYTLSVLPASSVRVAQGGAIALLVRVQPIGGFTGTPVISASSVSSGLSFAANTDTTHGPRVTALTVAADPNLTADPYMMTIRGTYPGLPDVVVDYPFSVVPPNLSLDFGTTCGTGTPIWLAAQDGDAAPWVRVLPVNGRYHLRLTAARAGLAFVTQGFGNNRSTIIQYGSGAELTAMSGDVLCGNPLQPTRTATASAIGLSGSENAMVTFGGGIRVFSQSLSSGMITGIAGGPHDLVARNAVTPGANHPNDRLIIRRDLNPPQGGSLGAALSFASGEAFAPVTATIGVIGLLPNEVVHSSGTVYFTRSCERASLWGSSHGAAITQFQARGVPTIMQRPTDFHGILYTAGIAGSAFRQVTEYSASLISHSVPLGNPMPPPTITTLPGTALRLRVQLTLPSDLSGPFDLSYSVNTGSPVFLTASTAWRGGQGVDVSVPDFSDMSGWSSSWGAVLQPGFTGWTVTGQGLSGSRCSNGTREVVANRNGVVP